LILIRYFVFLFFGFFSPAHADDLAAQQILNSGGTITKVAPDWLIVCIGGVKNDIGEISTPKHCRVEKYNFTAIAVVSKMGVSIPLKETISPCDNPPAVLAVDKKQNQKLPVESQIIQMAKGGVLGRSFETSWPECWPQIETTRLAGFSEAFAQLNIQWKKFK
jgi:hypothetical protein